MSGVIVAIEGLDATGKSTTVKLLAERLGAAVIGNPPASLAAARGRAELLPPEARRAWYLEANRVAMAEARAIAATRRPVVLDRSVVSTLVFGAAERGEIASLNHVPSTELLPDAIVLLHLPEEERLRRHKARGDERTHEERRLATDHAFRQRVLAGYRQLCTHIVSATSNPEQVVYVIRGVLAEKLEGGQSRRADYREVPEAEVARCPHGGGQLPRQRLEKEAP